MGGGRNEAPQKAIDLAELGYEVLLFADSDEPLEPSRDDVEKHGVKVIQWSGDYNTESRMCHDVPWYAIQMIVNLAISLKTEETILDQIGNVFIPLTSQFKSANIDSWCDDEITQDQVREAIAKTAHKKKWFKQIESSEQLGGIIANVLEDISDTDLAIILDEVKRWSIPQKMI